MRLLALTLGTTILFTGCVSSPKTYQAPNDARVKAATHDLNRKVNTARETAAKSKRATEEAKALLDRSVEIPPLIKAALEKLIIQVPQYAVPLRDVTVYADDLISKNAALQAKVGEIVAWNLQLETQLAQAEASRANLQKEQDGYAGGAQGLAMDATRERNEKIEVQRKLLWYRVRFWGAWVALGAAIIGWVIFGLLKFGIKVGNKSI